MKNLKSDGNNEIRDEGANSIKRKFSEEAAPKMSIELLQELQAHDEVKNWFDRVKVHIE